MQLGRSMRCDVEKRRVQQTFGVMLLTEAWRVKTRAQPVVAPRRRPAITSTASHDLMNLLLNSTVTFTLDLAAIVTSRPFGSAKLPAS